MFAPLEARMSMAATLTPIAALIDDLRALDARDFQQGTKVTELLHQVRVDPDSLAPFQHFAPGCYTRNLIWKDELFEVLALCWDVGQVSSIHNHRDQNCWMLVPEGALLAQNYRVLERDPARGTCRLEESTQALITPEDPAAVDNDEPVHQIRNLREYGQRATSIHIYSRPFDTCEVYSLEKGVYGDIQLHYWSAYGRLTHDRSGPGAR